MKALERVVARAAIRVTQWICGWHGHDDYLLRAPGRLSVVCVNCGRESPGWDLPQRKTVA